MTSKLEQIRNSLDKYINEELEKSPPDRDWEVFSFEDDLYEIIESFDQIIYYDPTPWLKIYCDEDFTPYDVYRPDEVHSSVEVAEFDDGAYRVHYECLTEEEKSIMDKNND